MAIQDASKSRATPEIPNRGARIFNGSDQTSSYRSLRESRLAVVISKIWIELHHRGAFHEEALMHGQVFYISMDEGTTLG